MKYFVVSDGESVAVEVDGDQLLVDGVRHTAHLEAVPDTPEQRVTVDGRVSTVAIDRFVDGSWRLVDRGGVREIAIEDERSRHFRSLIVNSKAASVGGVLKAPMPGLVVRIEVAVGDQVAVGAGLVVLEAMKMENELKAPAAGTVRAIRVAAGEAVEKGQPLLELEP